MTRGGSEFTLGLTVTGGRNVLNVIQPLGTLQRLAALPVAATRRRKPTRST